MPIYVKHQFLHLHLYLSVLTLLKEAANSATPGTGDKIDIVNAL